MLYLGRQIESSEAKRKNGRQQKRGPTCSGSILAFKWKPLENNAVKLGCRGQKEESTHTNNHFEDKNSKGQLKTEMKKARAEMSFISIIWLAVFVASRDDEETCAASVKLID